ncbi:Uncharacterised protein [Chryseobacterium indologenes]|nr:hypothetical protein CEQ15_02425 [Chryseobacterium indologenes]VFA44556.1 Uncharacterised protein [Chryseobacterium indologenes]
MPVTGIYIVLPEKFLLLRFFYALKQKNQIPFTLPQLVNTATKISYLLQKRQFKSHHIDIFEIRTLNSRYYQKDKIY